MKLNSLTLNKKAKTVLIAYLVFFLIFIIKTLHNNESNIDDLKGAVDSLSDDVMSLEWDVLDQESEIKNHEHY